MTGKVFWLFAVCGVTMLCSAPTHVATQPVESVVETVGSETASTEAREERAPTFLGRVLDSANEPIPLAEVMVTTPGAADPQGRETIAATETDEQGYFGLSLDPGVYVVEVSAPGYMPVAANVDITEGPVARDFFLNRTGTVFGRLIGLTAEKGRSLAARAEQGPGRTASDERLSFTTPVIDGVYEIGDLTEGWYQLYTVIAGQAYPSGPQVFVAAGTRNEVDLPVPALGTLEGIVRAGAEGSPSLLSFEIVYREPEYTEWATVPVLPGGRYKLEGLRPGPALIGVRARGFAALRRTAVTVSPGSPPTRFDIDYRGGVLSGKVISTGSGRPASNASVRFLTLDTAWRAETGNAEIGRAVVGPDGAFRLAGLAEGSYLVVAEAAGLAPWSKQVTCKNGADCVLNVAMSAGYDVTIQVVDPQGEIVPETIVLLRQEPISACLFEGRTDQEGRLVLHGVPAGDFTLSVDPALGRPAGSPDSGSGITDTIITVSKYTREFLVRCQ
ncbi:MAG: carboxypeptidase regulatory-like domain-containing protein [Acidobacteria bacterium]|nr:carboxypeptidase regulatory-like domain-containing protein [Acidobacteriota bacterium]